MSIEEQRLDLGQRVIGRYGCFSCHEIAGFEEMQPIGIELSEEGSKLLPRLDFAFVHDIPHTKVEWFKQKMRDPRAFDRNRVLQPLEKLRMPDFGMSEEEAKLFATAIMSFQSGRAAAGRQGAEVGPQRRVARGPEPGAATQLHRLPRDRGGWRRLRRTRGRPVPGAADADAAQAPR